jgi:hypothetical protein
MNAGQKNILYDNVAQLTDTNPWQLYKKVMVLPEKSKYFRIILALAQTSGMIFYDDIKAVALTQEEYAAKIQAETPPAPAITQAQKNLSNGNFENGISNWNGIATAYNLDKKEGQGALALQSKTETWTGADQQADVEKEATTLTISGWLKSIAITQGKDPWNKGVFILEFTDANKTKTTEDQLIGMIDGSTQWTNFSKEIKIPQGTTSYRIMLALSNCTGTLLADDIQVVFSKK